MQSRETAWLVPVNDGLITCGWKSPRLPLTLCASSSRCFMIPPVQLRLEPLIVPKSEMLTLCAALTPHKWGFSYTLNANSWRLTLPRLEVTYEEYMLMHASHHLRSFSRASISVHLYLYIHVYSGIGQLLTAEDPHRQFFPFLWFGCMLIEAYSWMCMSRSWTSGNSQLRRRPLITIEKSFQWCSIGHRFERHCHGRCVPQQRKWI